MYALTGQPNFGDIERKYKKENTKSQHKRFRLAATTETPQINSMNCTGNSDRVVQRGIIINQ
jgi:hypothetical protein